MVKLYVRKILAGEINRATGEAWSVADVPVKWREAVKSALENDGVIVDGINYREAYNELTEVLENDTE